MSFLYRKKIKKGQNKLLSKRNKYLNSTSFSIVCLKKGESLSYTLPQGEAALVILKGALTLNCGEVTYTDLGQRPDVFSGKAFSVYIRAFKGFYRLKAEENLELVIVEQALKKEEILGEKVCIIPPSRVLAKTVGKKNWQRKVYTIISPSFPAVKMLVGETVNPPGNWSSVPPHKHDINSSSESRHQELYFFKVKPETGFGFQRIYDKHTIDETYCILNNDLVVMPKGYHPVVSAPGHSLYYLWVLLGSQRTVSIKEDKDFSRLA